MEWHQRHPTGQLLSNANSDVEAAWGPIAPLPMAVGTVAMMVIAVAQMFAADVVLALVGLLVFPAVIAVNLVYQHFTQAADDPRPAAAGRGQRDRPRVLRRRPGGQDPGARAGGDGAVRRARPRAARRQHQGRPGAGRLRPGAGRPARARGPGRADRGCLAGAERPHRRRRRRHRRLPADHRVLPDPVPGLAARRVPAQRRGVPPGQRRARGHGRDAVRLDAPPYAVARARVSSSSGSPTPTTRRSRCSTA